MTGPFVTLRHHFPVILREAQNPETRRRNQRGLSESVQWAVLGAALLGCLLGLMQTGIVVHGRSVAVAAALAGAEAQASLRSQPGTAQQTAAPLAERGGLTDITVTVVTSANDVTVRVDARVPTFFGWMATNVHAESTRPWEDP